MTTFTAPYPTLADHTIGRRSALTSAVLVAGGAGLVGLAAQIAVPLWPVPITGQTLAVLLVGSTLGAARGAAALVLYAVAGILGVPWFSEASSGIGVVAGPTGGYIVGFIAAAALSGWLAQRRWDRRFARALPAFIAATALPFVFGLPWLAVSLGLDPNAALQAGLYPFLVGGMIKAVLAAALLPFCWFGLARLRPEDRP